MRDVIFPNSLYHTHILNSLLTFLSFSPIRRLYSSLAAPDASLILVETRSSYRQDSFDESYFMEFFLFRFRSRRVFVSYLSLSLNYSPQPLVFTESLSSASPCWLFPQLLTLTDILY